MGSGEHTSSGLSRAEAYEAVTLMLRGEADGAQMGAFLIAHRIRRPTPEELAGMLEAYRDLGPSLETPGRRALCFGVPYDGRDRTAPLLPLLALTLAAEGLPVVLHGGEPMPVKFGVTLAELFAHLVGDLLDASRIATGTLSLEVKPVELKSIVEAAVDALRPSIESRQLRMQIVLEPWIGPFQGDPERLNQIVWNLLSNAIKFTPPGGLIEVRLERLGNKALLIISDTGQGIDPEFLPHIFDRFRQADSSARRQQGGLGLGLSIVKHIVELHAGAIYAYSAGVGKGSDFMITLPLAVAETSLLSLPSEQAGQSEPGTLPWIPATEAAPPPARAMALRGARALVVDDDHDTREILSVMLRRYGAEIRTAGSVREALVAFGDWQPDVLVSDIGMPVEDGYALIRTIRARAPEEGGTVPAIALTAFAGVQDREMAIASGFHQHLSKPVEPVALARVVARLLGREETGIEL